MRKLLLALLLTQAAWAHEDYFVEWRQLGTTYQANRERLDRCLWRIRRTPKGNAFYFRDPAQRREMLLTYSQATPDAILSLVQPGHPRLREKVRCEVRGDSRFLSLTFGGSQCQGEVWLDLDWFDHGR